MHRLILMSPDDRVYVLEKPPRPTKPGSDIFKDGLHIVVPAVVTSPYTQFALRDAMLPHVRRIFGDHPSLSGAFDPAVVYDEAVILKNGWLMTGSKKPDEPHPWTLTRVYERVGGDTTLCPDPLPHLSEQVTLLSIRNKFLRTPCTDLGVERSLVWEIEEDRAYERRAAAAAAAAAGHSDVEPGAAAAPSAPLDEVAGLVDILDDARSVNYDTWFSMCRLLVNVTGGSKEGRDLFHAFSGRAGDGKYDEAGCDAVWGRLRTSPPADGRRLGMGTLVMWAREDDLDAYVAWQASRRRSSRPTADDTTAAAALENATDSAMDTAAISQRLQDMGWSADGECFVVRDRAAKTIRVSSGSARARICTDTFATTIWNDTDGQPPRFIGSFVETADVPGADVSRLHKDLPSDTTYTYQRQSVDRASLSSGAPHNTEVELLNPFTNTVHTRIRAVGAVARSVTNKSKVAMLQDAVRQALGNVGNVRYGIVNNVLAIHTGSGDINIGGDGAGAFDALRTDLVDDANQRRLQKLGGFVYKPVDGCPCAYEMHMEYDEYINEVLRNDSRLLANMRHVKELRTYLDFCDQDMFPKMRRDLDLLSFSNGVLRLSTVEFVPYDEDFADRVEFQSKVARHHIPAPWTGSTDTPLFDGVLSAQMPPEAANMLCALLGRTYFPVGQHDHWEVMPFLLGLAGTGKSTCVKILTKTFASAGVGSLCETNEAVFGLEGKYKKELLEAQDIPAKMSKFLEPALFQKMVSGENVSVAMKGKVAVDVPWTVPIIMCGNHLLDYEDVGGCISRRLVVFEFKTRVASQDSDLLSRIATTELPNIVCKLLTSYFATVRSNPGKMFWAFCPEYLKRTREAVRQGTSFVARFLAATEDEYNPSAGRSVCVMQQPGGVVRFSAFKEAFAKYMMDNHPGEKVKLTTDHSALIDAGYTVVPQMNVCKSCSKKSEVGCCASHSMQNRTRCDVVCGMLLQYATQS